MANNKKQLRDVSESVLMNEKLDAVIDCPQCSGKASKECSLCSGSGSVSKRKVQNLSK